MKRELRPKSNNVRENTNIKIKQDEDLKLYQVLLLIITVVILLFLISNQTFFSRTFTFIDHDKKINVNIPLFSYYVDNNNQEVSFYTMRDEKKLNDYFTSYLESDNFEIYKCYNFDLPLYYDKINKSFLYDLKVGKGFLKKYSFKYLFADYNTVCETFMRR